MRKEVIGNATLYLGDCLTVLPELQADAVITDPPYGCGLLGKAGRIGSHTSRSGIKGRIYDPVIGDDQPFDPSHLLSFPTVIMFGGNWFCNSLPASSCWLVWDKRCGTASNNMADVELAWTNIGGPSRIIHHRWMGMIRDSEKGINDREHPTQKPVEVMKWCIEQAGKPTVILDPYMGSGTTGVAAMQVGAKFIGIEVHAPYFDIACERIENAQRQERLFA